MRLCGHDSKQKRWRPDISEKPWKWQQTDVSNKNPNVTETLVVLMNPWDPDISETLCWYDSKHQQLNPDITEKLWKWPQTDESLRPWYQSNVMLTWQQTPTIKPWHHWKAVKMTPDWRQQWKPEPRHHWNPGDPDESLRPWQDLSETLCRYES